MISLRYLMVILFGVTAIGCVSPTSDQTGGLFSSFGALTSDDGTWVVTTTRRSTSLVDYTIADTATGTIHASGGGFSDAMRWFLYWDEQNRLWTHNSDMGPFGVWIYDGTSQFDFHEIVADDTLLDSIPQEVVDNLPNLMLRKLEFSSE